MHKKLSPKLLQTIVDRVVESANPNKIILFGSAQRGEMGPNSDVDILVVMPPGVHRRKTAHSIYRNLIGVGFATDIIVVTEDDVEQHKDNIGLVIKPALEEGRVLYAA